MRVSFGLKNSLKASRSSIGNTLVSRFAPGSVLMKGFGMLRVYGHDRNTKGHTRRSLVVQLTCELNE